MADDPLDLLQGSLSVGNPHVTICLTFRTPAPAAVVLEQVLSAINKHGMPHELTVAGCESYDDDEEEA